MAGVVLKVIDTYTAEIEMIDSGDIIRVDQTHCETVLPVGAPPQTSAIGATRGPNGWWRGWFLVMWARPSPLAAASGW